MRAAAVIYVGNLPVMRAFYQDGFGLVLAEGDSTYCNLESEVWSLTLVRSAEAIPASSPPPRRSGTPIKLAFDVSSIDGVRELINQLGGQVDPPDSTWAFGKTLRCDGTDPEGNVVQLVQPRDLP